MKFEQRYYSWRVTTKNFQFVMRWRKKEAKQTGNTGPYVPNGYRVIYKSDWLWILRRDSNAAAG